MSGHSKWATIKHKKAAVDAKKGKIFSRLAREIMIAARSGSDLSSNMTLRSLVQRARSVNMPADNIDRAIKKGTGELVGEALEEKMYEGFGPGGIQIVVQALTDNHNRTTAEIRNVFSRNGANLAQGVLRNFRRKGRITVADSKTTEDRLMEVALEAGADDLELDGNEFVVTTDPSALNPVVEAIQKAGIEADNSEVVLLPDAYSMVTDRVVAAAVMRIVDALDDLDDVQNVFTNMDVDEAVLASLGQE
ncbi:MAG: YebC/PmpR family DNA-binding transcriptional regulator [Kiritimatiellia bacterium]|nr:YebC/PmpR family DNA-binding transcriptional regulator [Kiritimatiellia bacterium]